MDLYVVGAIVLYLIWIEIALWLIDRFDLGNHSTSHLHVPHFSAYYFIEKDDGHGFVQIVRLTNAEALMDDGSHRLGVQVWYIQD